MYNSLPWEEDITRADALRRAGTTAPLREFYCFQLKRGKRESAGRSDIWCLSQARRLGLDALFVHRREGGKERRGSLGTHGKC